MAVAKAYTDPASGGRSQITRSGAFGTGLAKLMDAAVYRVSGSTGIVRRTPHLLVQGGARSAPPQGDPKPRSPKFKVAMRGSVILSTFPPVYKTALEAEAGKVKTPRVFPKIYIGKTR